MCEDGKPCEGARKNGVTEKEVAFMEERAAGLSPLFRAFVALVAEHRPFPRDVDALAAFARKWADSMDVEDEGQAGLEAWVHVERAQPYSEYDETGRIKSARLRPMMEVRAELEKEAEAELRANLSKATEGLRMAAVKLPRDLAEGIAQAMGVPVPPKDPEPIH